MTARANEAGPWLGLRALQAVAGYINTKLRKRSCIEVVSRPAQVVRRLQSGVMTFGDASPPVTLYGADNVDPASNKHKPSKNGSKNHSGSNGKCEPEMASASDRSDPRDTTGDGANGAKAHRSPVGNRLRGSNTNRRNAVSFTKGNRSDWTRLELFVRASHGLDQQVVGSVLAA